MNNYNNYFKIKKIITIMIDADRYDEVAVNLRAWLTLSTIEKMQEFIKQTEKRKEANPNSIGTN